MTEEQFESIVEMYQRPLESLIFRFVFDREQSRDLAQDVFMNLWCANRKIQDGHSPFTLIYRMAVNKAIDFLRKKKDFSREVEMEDMKNYEQEIITEDHSNLINECLGNLKLKQRSVFILHEIEGFDIKEIALMLKVNEGNVRSNLHLARRNMQKLLFNKYHLNREYFYEM